MTWNSPAPLQPASSQPTVAGGALTLGDFFSGSVASLRSALGLFVRLTLAPMALMLLSVGAVIVVAFLFYAPQRSTVPQVGPIVLLSLALLAASVAAYILYFVCLGRMSVAALDLAEGRGTPTWDNLRQRTPGLGRRVATLVVLVSLIVFALYGVLIAVALGFALRQDFSDTGEGGGVVLVVLGLVIPLLVVAAVFVAVRLVYTIVVLAEEGHSAFGALGRSWQLTRGAFWRTLGYWIVGSLVASAVSWLVQIVTLPLAIPAMRDGNDFSPMAAVYLVVGVVVTAAVSLLLIPFQTIWITLMYLGRRRELAGETVAPPPVWPGAPANPYGGFPPGAYPPGQYPPNQYPPGQYPPPGPWQQPGSPPQG